MKIAVKAVYVLHKHHWLLCNQNPHPRRALDVARAAIRARQQKESDNFNTPPLALFLPLKRVKPICQTYLGASNHDVEHHALPKDDSPYPPTKGVLVGPQPIYHIRYNFTVVLRYYVSLVRFTPAWLN